MPGLFIVWSSRFNTGIPILDEQHRGLVSIINSLFFHQKADSQDTQGRLHYIVEIFKAYLKFHFLTVEKMLEESAYPEADKYKSSHYELLETIRHVSREAWKMQDMGDIMKFLRDYWSGHVNGANQEYLDHLRAHYGRRNAPHR